jgi:molybdopterin converting factor small subunit
MPNVIVEFYGIPRQRAGRAELIVAAATLGDALALIERQCPELAGLCAEGRLAPHYRLSLDGKQFLTDLNQHLAEGSRLLLLSADAGG